MGRAILRAEIAVKKYSGIVGFSLVLLADPFDLG